MSRLSTNKTPATDLTCESIKRERKGDQRVCSANSQHSAFHHIESDVRKIKDAKTQQPSRLRAPTANRLTKAFGGAPQSTRRRNVFIGQSGQPVGRQMCERLLRRATGSANSGTDSRVSASVHTNRRTNSYTYLIRRVSRSTLARKSLSACFIVAPSPLRRPSMRSTVNPIICAAQLDDIIKS
ncbi:hypothetical protein V9T40_005028 [Parthenolecanium corni]|uniref:Uncharacterized protein n=1 Tax=Parthenolecanium corni TaxID=536013 RepID=A0AAN9TFK4_9HEMI